LVWLAGFVLQLGSLLRPLAWVIPSVWLFLCPSLLGFLWPTSAVRHWLSGLAFWPGSLGLSLSVWPGSLGQSGSGLSVCPAGSITVITVTNGSITGSSTINCHWVTGSAGQLSVCLLWAGLGPSLPGSSSGSGWVIWLVMSNWVIVIAIVRLSKVGHCLGCPSGSLGHWPGLGWVIPAFFVWLNNWVFAWAFTVCLPGPGLARQLGHWLGWSFVCPPNGSITGSLAGPPVTNWPSTGPSPSFNWVVCPGLAHLSAHYCPPVRQSVSSFVCLGSLAVNWAVRLTGSGSSTGLGSSALANFLQCPSSISTGSIGQLGHWSIGHSLSVPSSGSIGLSSSLIG